MPRINLNTQEKEDTRLFPQKEKMNIKKVKKMKQSINENRKLY